MTAYQEAMRAAGRMFAVAGTLTLPDGREVTLTGADVVALRVDEGVDDGLLAGAVLSAKHTLKLANAGGQWLPGGSALGSGALRGATVRLFIGAQGLSEALCTFIVREAEAEKGAATATLSGYDSLYEETAGAFADNLTYPATLNAVVRHILGNTRYALPASVPNGGCVIAKKPDWGNCAVRQALGWALALSGCYARVSRAGALEIRPVWTADAVPEAVGEAATLRRDYGYADFGPLQALRATSVRAVDDDAGAEELEALADNTVVAGAQNALHLGANPLLIAGSAQSQALLAAALARMRGMTLTRTSFRFRGDPTLTVGTLVSVDGAVSLLTRQKLVLAEGFSAECELGAPDESDNTLRAITPEGGLNAARLTGTVDGGLLAVESVTAAAIRAGSVTTGKLAAASVSADKLAAGAVTAEKLDAETVNAAVASIARAEIGTAVLDTARIADGAITSAKIADAAIGTAKIGNAAVTGAKIGTAAVDTAKIALGAITTALIAAGAVGTAQIADGSITDAKVVSLNADVITAGTLSVERLLLQGANGLFYALNATDEGLTAAQLSETEYQNALSGTVLVARSVTADKIAARSLTANEIAAETITGAEIHGDAIEARHIRAGAITTNEVAADFGDQLNISSNAAIALLVGKMPLVAEVPPAAAPDAGRLWLDEGVTPSVWRRWRGAEVSTARGYNAVAAGNPAVLDNTPGHIERIAPMVTVAATETGTGAKSPANPYTINGAAGASAHLFGRNLLPPQVALTKNGVTVTTAADGGVRISGTCTAAPGSWVIFPIQMDLILTGQYTFSMGNGAAVGQGLQMQLWEANNTPVGSAATNVTATVANSGVSFTLDRQYVYGWALRVGGGETYDVTVYPQLEAGTTATAFAEHQNGGALTCAFGTTVYGARVDWAAGKWYETHGYIASYAGETVPDGWTSGTGELTAGTQVVYPLATEIEHDFAVETLPALAGVNTVLAGGAMTVTYSGSGWAIVNDTGELAEGVRAAASGLEAVQRNLGAWFTFDTDGLTVGNAGSQYYTITDSEGFHVYQRGVGRIATFAYNRMWGPAAELDDYVQLGEMSIWHTPDGNLCID